ncbi:MAG: hypothetical protein WCP72_09335 [Desulfomonile sp.]
MSEAPKTDQNQVIDISSILNNPQIQKLHVNRTVVGNTISDMFVIAQSTGTQPVVIQMSFITAKTLDDDLLKMITEFEDKTGQKILSMKDIQGKLSKQFSGAPM